MTTTILGSRYAKPAKLFTHGTFDSRVRYGLVPGYARGRVGAPCPSHEWRVVDQSDASSRGIRMQGSSTAAGPKKYRVTRIRNTLGDHRSCSFRATCRCPVQNGIETPPINSSLATPSNRVRWE